MFNSTIRLPGFVYLIQVTDWNHYGDSIYKIGYTAKFPGQMWRSAGLRKYEIQKGLPTGNQAAVLTCVPGSIEQEQELHRRLQSCQLSVRRDGHLNEWYFGSGSFLDFVEECKRTTSIGDWLEAAENIEARLRVAVGSDLTSLVERVSNGDVRDFIESLRRASVIGRAASRAGILPK